MQAGGCCGTAGRTGYGLGGCIAFSPTGAPKWQVWQAKDPRNRLLGRMTLMKNEALTTSEQSLNGPVSADAEIESLARETEMPVELVQEKYSIERARLERSARIKTYVPVLVHRHVKALLREQRT